MAPVLAELEKSEKIFSKICVTAQHREMLDGVLNFFGIVPDYDLALMVHNQGLHKLFSTVVEKTSEIILAEKPDLVLVHGDTVTTSAACVSSYLSKVPIAHVEAGLRSGEIYSPWPEEGSRKLVASLARFHFAPTKQASLNLIKEGVLPENIEITGNTVVDALEGILQKIDENADLREKIRTDLLPIDLTKNIILITCHRRENQGKGLQELCKAIKRLAKCFPDNQFVFPIHPNPNISEPIRNMLANGSNIILKQPLDYPSFIFLLKNATLVLTDSGGVQEEAGSLGKVVVILRSNTERPEVLQGANASLVGCDEQKIVSTAMEALYTSNKTSCDEPLGELFGDGQAGRRIVEFLEAKIAQI